MKGKPWVEQEKQWETYAAVGEFLLAVLLDGDLYAELMRRQAVRLEAVLNAAMGKGMPDDAE